MKRLPIALIQSVLIFCLFLFQCETCHAYDSVFHYFYCFAEFHRGSQHGMVFSIIKGGYIDNEAHVKAWDHCQTSFRPGGIVIYNTIRANVEYSEDKISSARNEHMRIVEKSGLGVIKDAWVADLPQ